jgi:hypothetical protein
LHDFEKQEKERMVLNENANQEWLKIFSRRNKLALLRACAWEIKATLPPVLLHGLLSAKNRILLFPILTLKRPFT